MTPEHELELYNKFPDLYKQHDLPMQQTCMCWGFECPDDWYYVIYELSERITTYMNEHNFKIEASQVKEKYGTLRVHIDFIDEIDQEHVDHIYKFIDEADFKVQELERIKRIKNGR